MRSHTRFAKTAAMVVLLSLAWALGLLVGPAIASGAQQELACDEVYTVQKGDWLSKIAEKYYGDPLAYDRIVMAANAGDGDVYTGIENPDLIQPGWVLCIPALVESSAAASTPQLVGPVWAWGQSEMSDNTFWEPADPASYTVQFSADEWVSIQADCNQVGGSYTVDGSSLAITLGPSTMAACGPGSIADQFLAQLAVAASYYFQEGDLFIDVQDAAGRMRFSAPAGHSGGEAAVAYVPALHRTWGWQKRIILDSGAEEQIDDPSKYTLTFKADGTYGFQADCNSGSGGYVADERGAIRLQPGPVTLAECGPDSRYQDMLNMMQAVQDYRLEEDGAALVMVWPAGGPEDYYR